MSSKLNQNLNSAEDMCIPLTDFREYERILSCKCHSPGFTYIYYPSDWREINKNRNPIFKRTIKDKTLTNAATTDVLFAFKN